MWKYLKSIISIIFIGLAIFLILGERSFAGNELLYKVPENQKEIYSQLGIGSVGGISESLSRAFILYWPADWYSHSENEYLVSGFSIFVNTYDTEYGILDKSHFTISVANGNFPDPKVNRIISDLSPTSARVVSGKEGGGTYSPTYQLDFIFPEAISFKRPVTSKDFQDGTRTVFLDVSGVVSPQRYRLLETGNYHLGLSQYYDAKNKSYFSLFGRKSNELAPKIILYSRITKSAIGTPPIKRPLVLLHGLGGRPENWKNGLTDYSLILKNDNYPEDYLSYYDFGKNSDGSYNYDGDIRDMASGLGTVIAELSEKHRNDGGDGEVDLLGYSLGGIVARQYLAANPENHNVRKLLTVGSPHQGVWSLGIGEEIRRLPFAGETVEKTLKKTIVSVINADKPNQPLNPESRAVKQLTPESDFYKGESGINITVSKDTSYATFFGDIRAKVSRVLFGRDLSREISLGDGVVSTESASLIPNVETEKYSYSGDLSLDLNLNKIGVEYKLELTVPDISSLEALHTNLINRKDLRDDLLAELSRK